MAPKTINRMKNLLCAIALLLAPIAFAQSNNVTIVLSGSQIYPVAPSNNIVFVTNNGVIYISSVGGGGGGIPALAGTNVAIYYINGSNQFNVPYGLFDSNTAAQLATNGLASGAFTSVGTVVTLSSNQVIGMAGAAVAGSNYAAQAAMILTNTLNLTTTTNLVNASTNGLPIGAFAGYLAGITNANGANITNLNTSPNTFILYAGPPTNNPGTSPPLGNIIVDSTGREWMYWSNAWW